MVHFGGRPSRGCRICRNRKIKCDLKVGGCSYCEKTGILCPGFRAEVDIIFRDESQHVADKVKRNAKALVQKQKKRKKDNQNAPSDLSLAISFSRSSLQSDFMHGTYLMSTMNRVDERITATSSPYATISSCQSSPITPQLDYSSDESPHSPNTRQTTFSTSTLEYSLEEQALAFFFKYNCYDASNFYSLRSQNDIVFTSCLAVGFAGLSCFKKTTRVELASQRTYMRAMQNVNRALADPKSAAKDGTLFAILMLGQAEQIGGAEKNFVGWDQHIRGAGAVLALRGTRSLTTVTQVRLFHQAISALISSCLRMRIAFPAGVLELLQLATRNSDKSSPGYRALIVSVKITTWLADIRSGALISHEMILELARALDTEAQEVFMAAPNPSDWAYESIFEATNDNISMLNHYHNYKSWTSVQTWNGIRAVRILIHQVIIDTLLASMQEEINTFSTEELDTQLYVSNKVVSQLRIDVLASMAQQLNGHPADALQKSHSSALSIECMERPQFLWSNFHDTIPSSYIQPHSPSDLPPVRPAGGILPWVLYLIGLGPQVSDTHQHKIHAALHYIGHNLGMKQALSLASDLDARTGLARSGRSIDQTQLL